MGEGSAFLFVYQENEIFITVYRRRPYDALSFLRLYSLKDTCPFFVHRTKGNCIRSLYCPIWKELLVQNRDIFNRNAKGEITQPSSRC